MKSESLPDPADGHIQHPDVNETMRRTSTPAGILSALLVGAWTITALAAQAEEVPHEDARRFCDQALSGQEAFRSEAAGDLYNAALWLGGTAVMQFGVPTDSRWSSRNGLDTGIRDGLRAGSASSREDAATASDVLLGLSAGALPLVSIGKVISDRDCLEAYDMATDMAESIALTLFITEATKSIAGRDRPFARDCKDSPPRDAKCDSDRRQSFFSGHSSLAGAGAGLSCAYAIKRNTGGEGSAARIAPCAVGAGLALAPGALRLVADTHWSTDVLVGLAVGASVGYFDTWGPFDLLSFEVESNDLAHDIRGIVLPYAARGEIGLRMGLSF